MTKMYQDAKQPGIIRFDDGDEFSGLLAGIRAPEIVKRFNAHDELVAVLAEYMMLGAGKCVISVAHAEKARKALEAATK
jgi:hypothetical protein